MELWKKCLWDDGAEWTLPCKARNTDLPVSLLLLGPLKSRAKESFRWCKYFDVKKISGRKIRPHQGYKGREHPDGISQLRFGFIWERRGIFWKKPPFLVGRDVYLHKKLEKIMRNKLIRCRQTWPEKVKKPRIFQFLGFIFRVCNVFFSFRWCGVAQKHFFVFAFIFGFFSKARATVFCNILVF